MCIDPSKPVYMDTKYFDKLQDLARSKLIEMGFDKNQLVFVPDAAKYGEAGHYIARIWKSKKGTTLTVSQMESIELCNSWDCCYSSGPHYDCTSFCKSLNVIIILCIRKALVFAIYPYPLFI